MNTKRTRESVLLFNNLFPECSSSNTKMKRHILYKHLPKCFSEDRKSRNDHEMCVHALDSLSIAILGRTDLNELLNIVSSPGAIPDYSNIHPNLVEKMKGFSNHNSWQIPAKFSLHPINSKALLLHYRCLCCLVLLLSEEQGNDFMSAVVNYSSENKKIKKRPSSSRSVRIPDNDLCREPLTTVKVTFNTSSKSSSRTVESKPRPFPVVKLLIHLLQWRPLNRKRTLLPNPLLGLWNLIQRLFHIVLL